MDDASLERRELLGLACELADRLWHLANAWEPFPRGSLGIPLVTSADAVGAHAAAGLGRAPPEVRSRAIGEARGALEACFFRVRRALACGLITGYECAELQALMAELEARLAAAHLEVCAPMHSGAVHDAGGASPPVACAEVLVR